MLTILITELGLMQVCQYQDIRLPGKIAYAKGCTVQGPCDYCGSIFPGNLLYFFTF